MGSVAQLQLFHHTLDDLLMRVRRFVYDLEEKAKRDDLAMARWRSGVPLLELDNRDFVVFEAWRLSMYEFCGEIRETPKAGAESHLEYFGVHPDAAIASAFIRVRESIGYCDAGRMPRLAINVFEEVYVDFCGMISGRLTTDWPRPNLHSICRDVNSCWFDLTNRQLQRVAELVRTEQHWWSGVPASDDTENTVSHDTPLWETHDLTLSFRGKRRQYGNQLGDAARKLFSALNGSGWTNPAEFNVPSSQAAQCCKDRTEDNGLGILFQYDSRTKIVRAHWG